MVLNKKIFLGFFLLVFLIFIVSSCSPKLTGNVISEKETQNLISLHVNYLNTIYSTYHIVEAKDLSSIYHSAEVSRDFFSDDELITYINSKIFDKQSFYPNLGSKLTSRVVYDIPKTATFNTLNKYKPTNIRPLNSNLKLLKPVSNRYTLNQNSKVIINRPTLHSLKPTATVIRPKTSIHFSNLDQKSLESIGHFSKQGTITPIYKTGLYSYMNTKLNGKIDSSTYRLITSLSSKLERQIQSHQTKDALNTIKQLNNAYDKLLTINSLPSKYPSSPSSSLSSNIIINGNVSLIDLNKTHVVDFDIQKNPHDVTGLFDRSIYCDSYTIKDDLKNITCYSKFKDFKGYDESSYLTVTKNNVEIIKVNGTYTNRRGVFKYVIPIFDSLINSDVLTICNGSFLNISLTHKTWSYSPLMSKMYYTHTFGINDFFHINSICKPSFLFCDSYVLNNSKTNCYSNVYYSTKGYPYADSYLVLKQNDVVVKSSGLLNSKTHKYRYDLDNSILKKLNLRVCEPLSLSIEHKPYQKIFGQKYYASKSIIYPSSKKLILNFSSCVSSNSTSNSTTNTDTSSESNSWFDSFDVNTRCTSNVLNSSIPSLNCSINLTSKKRLTLGYKKLIPSLNLELNNKITTIKISPLNKSKQLSTNKLVYTYSYTINKSSVCSHNLLKDKTDFNLFIARPKSQNVDVLSLDKSITIYKNLCSNSDSTTNTDTSESNSWFDSFDVNTRCTSTILNSSIPSLNCSINLTLKKPVLNLGDQKLIPSFNLELNNKITTIKISPLNKSKQLLTNKLVYTYNYTINKSSVCSHNLLKDKTDFNLFIARPKSQNVDVLSLDKSITIHKNLCSESNGVSIEKPDYSLNSSRFLSCPDKFSKDSNNYLCSLNIAKFKKEISFTTAKNYKLNIYSGNAYYPFKTTVRPITIYFELDKKLVCSNHLKGTLNLTLDVSLDGVTKHIMMNSTKLNIEQGLCKLSGNVVDNNNNNTTDNPSNQEVTGSGSTKSDDNSDSVDDNSDDDSSSSSSSTSSSSHKSHKSHSSTTGKRCSLSVDCGTPHFVGDATCDDNNNKYRDYVTSTCSAGYCIEVTESILIGECITGCDDGTSIMSCSSFKPYFCDDSGNLVQNCNYCGCDEGSTCINNECIVSNAYYNNVGAGYESDDSTDAITDDLYEKDDSSFGILLTLFIVLFIIFLLTLLFVAQSKLESDISYMDLERIKNYIVESRSAGYSDYEIKMQLKQVGWKKKEINKAFKSL